MLSGFQFNKEVQIKLTSLILKEAECNWCKERLYLYLMNRCIRDPYVQWCERRTSSLTSGEAVYSIVRSPLFLYGLFLVVNSIASENVVTQ
jgi:hypothetical protein